jgi:hypothetical protein
MKTPTSLTRRSFIRKAAAAGAFIAGPQNFHTGSLAHPDQHDGHAGRKEEKALSKT